jgi:hypothetical protein
MPRPENVDGTLIRDTSAAVTGIHRLFPTPTHSAQPSSAARSAAARCEIVGIVGDVRSLNLAQPNDVECYLPLTQRSLDVARDRLRTAGDPRRMLNDVRAAVRAVDPELPLNQPRAARRRRRHLTRTAQAADDSARRVRRPRAAPRHVGIYSVVAYLVGQPPGEIGVRLALGASNVDVLQTVTLDGLRPVTAGLAIGVAGVAALGHPLAIKPITADWFHVVALGAAPPLLRWVLEAPASR